METMENWIQKANVLNEALPYIQRFQGKIIVVKYGGSAMVDHELKKNVIRDVALLKLVGFRPIIVHGGGKEITKWVNKVGLETNFVNGLRVTDKDTMEVLFHQDNLKIMYDALPTELLPLYETGKLIIV